jgi:hypothetical protein
MKIVFTSMIWQEVSEIVRCVTVQLEDELIPVFSAKNYGANIDEFIGLFVAMGPPTENEEYSKKDNKVGTYKCPLTGDKVKYLSFALPFHPSELVEKSADEIKRLFCNALYERLDQPNVKMPKSFEYGRFVADFKLALQDKK